MFRIADGRDVPLGLVHQQIDVPFGTMQQLAVDADVVAIGIGLGTKFRDNFSVDRDASANDQLLGFSPGSDSSGCDDFLEAFRGHEN